MSNTRLADPSHKELFLHIGRHKTGTSSIQNFVHEYRDLLLSKGMMYPETGRKGVAHHAIPLLVKKAEKNISVESTSEALNSLWQNLLAEITDHKGPTLLSSEAFQNIDPSSLVNVFKDYKVTILIYLRGQQDYLASSYAQKVWASRYTDTIENYYKKIFDGDYGRFLGKWDSAFPNCLKVRLFERSELYKQDVVEDFFYHMLGETESQIMDSISNRINIDSSPSLTTKLLQFKLAYNAMGIETTPQIERKFLNALSNLSATIEDDRVLLSENLADICIEDYKVSNNIISKKYFNSKPLFTKRKPTAEKTEVEIDELLFFADKICIIDSALEQTMLEFKNNMLNKKSAA